MAPVKIDPGQPAGVVAAEPDHAANGKNKRSRVGWRNFQRIVFVFVCQRPRVFLVFGVVGVVAVLLCWVGRDDEREGRLPRRSDSRELRCWRSDRFCGRVRDDAVVQPLLPVGVEVAACLRRAGLAHECIRIGGERAREQAEEMMRASRIVQRAEQRLHDARRAVDGAQIAPRFERMRHWQPPLAAPRGLVIAWRKAGA